MTAPYAAATATEPVTMPTVVPRWVELSGDEVASLPLNGSLFGDGFAVAPLGLGPAAEPPSAGYEPRTMSMAGLISMVRL